MAAFQQKEVEDISDAHVSVPQDSRTHEIVSQDGEDKESGADHVTLSETAVLGSEGLHMREQWEL